MAKNVGIRLQLIDEASKELKKTTENISATTREIKKQAKEIAGLKTKLAQANEVKLLGSKEEAKAAIENIKHIKAEIGLQKAKSEELKAQLAIDKDLESEQKKKLNNAKKSIELTKKETSSAKDLLKTLTKAAVVQKAMRYAVSGVTTGITVASELETLRANIETVTKSPARASEVMKHAVHLANRSAFDNAEMVEAASMLETYGLNTEKFLTTVGDTAAVFDRDVVDIARGFGKAAVGGQFDILGDLGITRVKLNEYAKAKGIDLFDGNVVKDSALLADTLKMFMDENYAGGMEKQADTLTGMWSTIKGIGRSALGIITGVRADGKIVDGSLFDTLKEKLDGIRDTMTEWEASGAFESIAKKMEPIVSGFESIEYALSKIKNNAEVEWITDNLGTGAEIIGSLTKAFGKLVEFNVFAASWIPNLIAGKKDTVAKDFKSLITWNAHELPSYASGTSYHPGGTALVGERGPELVNLPRGSSVQNSSATRSILRGGNTVNIYINGARRSDDEIANTVARKLLEALDNV